MSQTEILTLDSFELGVRANSYVVMDVQHTNQGATLRLQEKKKASNSKWKVKPYTGGLNPENLEVFVICNVNNENNVITFDDYDQTLTLKPFDTNNLGQLWEIYDTSDGWRFRSFEVSSLVVGTRDQKIDVGTDIIASNNWNLQTQLWVPDYGRSPATGITNDLSLRYSIRTRVGTTFGIVKRRQTAIAGKITNLPDRKYQVTWDTNKQAYTIIQKENNDIFALSFDSETKDIVFKYWNAGDLTQYWNIETAADKTNSSHLIKPLTRPSQCIEVSKNLDRIFLYQANGDYNQQWEFLTKHSNQTFNNKRVQFMPRMKYNHVITQNSYIELGENKFQTKQGFLLKYDQTKDAYQIWDINSKQILAWNTVSYDGQVFMHPNEGKDEHYWVFDESVIHNNGLSGFNIVNYKDTRKILGFSREITPNSQIQVVDQDDLMRQVFYISTFELYDDFGGKGAELLFTSNWNDKISSVRIPPYSTAKFWEHGGFQGKIKEIYNNSNEDKIFDLTDFNNMASSFCVYLDQQGATMRDGNANAGEVIINRHREFNPDSTCEIDKKEKKITLNFYNSTCNIFVNDDHRAE